MPLLLGDTLSMLEFLQVKGCEFYTYFSDGSSNKVIYMLYIYIVY